jgi:hypothetical protein
MLLQTARARRKSIIPLAERAKEEGAMDILTKTILSVVMLALLFAINAQPVDTYAEHRKKRLGGHRS